MLYVTDASIVSRWHYFIDCLDGRSICITRPRYVLCYATHPREAAAACSRVCSSHSARLAGSWGWPAARHASGGGGGPSASPSDASSEPSACRTRPASVGM